MSASVALRPMTAAEFAAYETESATAYAAEKVASGQWQAADAVERSRAAFTELLPAGLATPDNHVCVITDSDGQRVGMLWYAELDRAGERICYIFDVSIDPEHRRKGLARAALQALETVAAGRGLTGIGLHVFGHNRSAHALYVELGFEPTNIHMFKRFTR